MARRIETQGDFCFRIAAPWRAWKRNTPSFHVPVADVYDPAIPVAENEAYVAKVRKILDEWGPEMQEKMQEIRNSG